MVRRDGIVKVLDFGLAKLTEPVPRVADARAYLRWRSHHRAGVCGADSQQMAG